jgi:hypothetical protein
VRQGNDDFIGTIEAQDRATGRYTVVKPDGTKTFATSDQVQAVEIPVQSQQPGVPTQVQGVELPAHLMPNGMSPPPGAVPSDPTVQVVGASSASPQPAMFPTPGQPMGERLPFTRPVVGTSINGVPLQPGAAPVVGLATPIPGAAPPQPPPPAPQPPRRPSRFMVKTEGGDKVFHTRIDCPNVLPGDKKLDVTDDQIDFFDLTRCPACEHRDKQITFVEALHAHLGEVGASATIQQVTRAVNKVKEWGFVIDPDAVDR